MNKILYWCTCEAVSYNDDDCPEHGRMIMDTEFIEINFEDGSSARWAVDNPDLLDRAVLALCDVLGNPQTIKG